jgi:hypothetical protein
MKMGRPGSRALQPLRKRGRLGVNVSTNVKFGKDTLRASVLYGEGIENYMNDAPVDVGPKATTNPLVPIDGDPLPVFGLSAFYDKTWTRSGRARSATRGLDIDNSDLQAADAFAKGQYALVNMLYYPVDNVMLGPEIQWGGARTTRTAARRTTYRIQFSARYKFGHSWGGQ